MIALSGASCNSPKPESKPVEEEPQKTVIQSDALNAGAKETAQNSKRNSKAVDKFTNTTYKVYYQDRWGYKISYPSFLTDVFYPENGDGARFSDNDQMELSTYGMWNINENTIEELFQENDTYNGKVTYRRLLKNENSFIKSGYTEDGRIFYTKTCIANSLNGAPIICLELIYPKEYQRGVDPIINKIFKDFKYSR